MGERKLRSAAEWVAGRKLKALLVGVDVNADIIIEELAKTPENGAAFHAAISAFKKKGGAAASVYAYSPEEYAQMRLFLTLGFQPTALLHKLMAFPAYDPHRQPVGFAA